MIYILLRNYWRYIYLRWSAGDCSIPLVFCWCLAVSYFIIIILLSFSHLLGTQIRFILYLDFCLFFFLFSLSLSLSLYLAFYTSGIKKSVCLPKKKIAWFAYRDARYLTNPPPPPTKSKRVYSSDALRFVYGRYRQPTSVPGISLYETTSNENNHDHHDDIKHGGHGGGDPGDSDESDRWLYSTFAHLNSKLLIFSLNKITCTSPLHCLHQNFLVFSFWTNLFIYYLNCVFICLHFCPAH